MLDLLKEIIIHYIILLTPKLGSNSNNNYFISEISSDRTEIRLDTTSYSK
jgi:hypothetical protein